MTGWRLRLRCPCLESDDGVVLYASGYPTPVDAEEALEQIADVVVGPWMHAHAGHDPDVQAGIE